MCKREMRKDGLSKQKKGEMWQREKCEEDGKRERGGEKNREVRDSKRMLWETGS